MHSPTAREIADAFNYSHQCFGPDQDPALALADIASRIGNILESAGMCDYSSFVDIASRSGLEIDVTAPCADCGEPYTLSRVAWDACRAEGFEHVCDDCSNDRLIAEEQQARKPARTIEPCIDASGRRI